MPAACPICTHEVAEQARFCPRCGAEVGEPRLCSATRLSPLLALWRRISTATTRKELRGLLGEPLRIAVTGAPGAATETWTYEYVADDPAGQRVGGWVAFSVEQMRVIAWSEPDWRQITPG